MLTDGDSQGEPYREEGDQEDDLLCEDESRESKRHADDATQDGIK